MKYINKNSTTFIFIGILFGILLSFFISSAKNDTSNIPDTNRLVMQVTEEEEVCPVKGSTGEDNAKVTFLPVTISDDNFAQEHELIGQEFDPIELGKDLYNPNSDTPYSLSNPYPWFIEEVDIDLDSKKEQIYYGNIAMTKGSHVAYVVKDGKVVFTAAGANIQVEQSLPNGVEVNETLDWNIGKYRKTKFEYLDGQFIPRWYQITCAVE